jgi:hypothetical protein
VNESFARERGSGNDSSAQHTDSNFCQQDHWNFLSQS